eukprot:11639288-Alexandrium_andersonii.AAC.1
MQQQPLADPPAEQSQYTAELHTWQPGNQTQPAATGDTVPTTQLLQSEVDPVLANDAGLASCEQHF